MTSTREDAAWKSLAAQMETTIKSCVHCKRWIEEHPNGWKAVNGAYNCWSRRGTMYGSHEPQESNTEE